MKSISRIVTVASMLGIASAASAADAPAAAAPAAAAATPAATAAAPAAAAATPAAVNTKPYPYGHTHLYYPDPAAAQKWYVDNMGGVAEPNSTNVTFGRVRFLMNPIAAGRGGAGRGAAAGAAPGAAPAATPAAPAARPGTVGSTVDHIGFSFANVDEKMTQLKAANVKVVAELKDHEAGKFKYGFVEDPWGVKIEIIQDPDMLGFHHFHLMTQDPAASAAWYAKIFGGEVGKFKGVDGITMVKWDGALGLFAKSETKLAGTQNRTLDHLGFEMKNTDAAVAEMAAQGGNITTQPLTFQARVRIAFINDPDDTRIELVETLLPGDPRLTAARGAGGAGRGAGGAGRGAGGAGRGAGRGAGAPGGAAPAAGAPAAPAAGAPAAPAAAGN